MKSRDELLEGLNLEQQKAVSHEHGPLLIVAGAGTGKTTVLTRRYGYLLAGEGMKTDNLLALTFTEKAAGEMEDRILQLLPTGTYDFWISTFHGFCQRVLEEHALEIGLSTPFRLLTPTDAWLLLRRRFEELPLKHYRPLGNPLKFLRGILQHISRAKDEGVAPEMYQAFIQNAKLEGEADVVEGERARLQELADIYSAYRKILLEEEALDFGDLILETLRLFRERPHILEVYRKQFKFILVDEFQDTNWAQYELIKLLGGFEKNITVVGDDDQAIYKFRGASLANILQFRDDFPEAVTVALTKNYRSKKEILDRAYDFICHNNPNRLEVKLQDTGLTKRLEAISGEGGEVELLWSGKVEDEAEQVIEQIREKKRLDPSVQWSDFAILVRSNDGADPFVEALDRHKIPFQFLALRGLYTKPIIVDVVALFSVLHDHHDSPAVWRAMTLPCYAFGAKDIAECLHYANRKGVILWQAVKDSRSSMPELRLSEEGRKSAEHFVAHVEELALLARRATPLKLLQELLEKTGYLGHLLTLPEAERKDSLHLLNSYAERIKRYEQAVTDPSLKGFLEEFRLEVESGEEGALEFDPDTGPDMVKILTVHAAKGLEFRYVFVVSMVDQRFPTRARSESIPLPDGLVQERLPEGNVHIEEERRLFYVALTRAKEGLYLTGAFDYGGSREKKASSFIAEAGFTVPDVTAVHRSSPEENLAPKKSPEVNEVPADHSFYQLKRRFSFTQLAAFRKCPLQYKFAHVYRIPTFGSFQRSFGQSIHLTFQRILQLHVARNTVKQPSLFAPAEAAVEVGSGFRVTNEEAERIYQDAWIDEWYSDRKEHDKYWARGKVALAQFMERCRQSPPDVFEIEREFILLLGQHSMKGKIDRVDRLPDGSLYIYDYKTGEAKEKLETEDKEQLYLYQVALEERGLKIGGMAYLYVTEGVTRDVELLTGKDREAFLTKMENRMSDILHSDFKATPEPFSCKHCDFRNVCEFKKL